MDDHFVIHRDQGGDLEGYALHFSMMKRQARVVKVEDACISACTMVLNNPKACAMPGAHFGFHQAKVYSRSTLEILEVSDAGNKLLWGHYPEKVRARLGQLTPYMVYIKGTDLLPPRE